MVSNLVWPILSSILSTGITGGIWGVWRAIKRTHARFDSIERHLVAQDTKIARIEGRLGAGNGVVHIQRRGR